MSCVPQAALLPTDAIGNILGFLPPPDILQNARVCKAWLRASNELSWMALYKRLFPQYNHLDHQAANSEWKRLTLERYAYQQIGCTALDAQFIRHKLLATTQFAPTTTGRELIDKLTKKLRAIEVHLNAVETLSDFILGKTSMSEYFPPEKDPHLLLKVAITERLANQNALRHYFADSSYFSRITWVDRTHYDRIETSLTTEFVVYFPSTPAPYYFHFARNQSGWAHESLPSMKLFASPYSFNIEKDAQFQNCALKYAAHFPKREQMEEVYSRLRQGELFSVSDPDIDERTATNSKAPQAIPKALPEQQIYDRIQKMVPTIARPRFVLFLLRVAYCPAGYWRDIPSEYLTENAIRTGLIQSQLPNLDAQKLKNMHTQHKRQKTALVNESQLLSSKQHGGRVSSLVNHLFNESILERVVSDMGYSVEQMPLRLLSKQQLEDAGDELHDLWLRRVQGTLDFGENYLNLIPHYPKLSKEALVNELVLCREAELLAALDGVPSAIDIIKQVEDGVGNYYDHLFRSIVVVERESPEFNTIGSFLECNSHAGLRPKLAELYRLERATETERFEKALANQKLLWYFGSTKLTNIGTLLAFGLPLIPPRRTVPFLAPLGKGYHFTDALTHAASLSRVSEDDPSSFLVLCDVALGNTFVEKRRDAAKPPSDEDDVGYFAPDGCDSVFQVGRFAPSPAGDVGIEDIYTKRPPRPILSAGKIVPVANSYEALSDYSVRCISPDPVSNAIPCEDRMELDGVSYSNMISHCLRGGGD